MTRTTLTLVLCAASALSTSCASEADVGSRVPRGAVPDGPVQLDVLFVIDNSGSMAEEQDALAANFNNFIEALTTLPSGLPDLHIAIVSSNSGISPFQTTGCVGNGDDGKFLNYARGDCTPPFGYFISDVADPFTGDRVTNYSTTLEETFACIARLGSTGCGLEQHFESMKRALDGHRTENANFLRPDAFLAVVFIADEDDCSAEDGAVFDPAQNDISDPLGPFGSFRCPEFGIVCDGMYLARSPTTYTSCEPRSDSYLHHPSHYVDFLNGIKDNPNKVVVAAIVGDPAPVAVATDSDGNPTMSPACTSSHGSAWPGVRFRWFLDQFGPRGAFTSICDDDLSIAISAVGITVRSAIIDFPTAPDAGVPGIDGGESSGCAVGHGGAGGPAGALLLLGLALAAVRRRAR